MKSVQSVIYAINRIGTGACYIGIHDDVYDSKGHNRRLLVEGKHPSKKLQAAWDKHGTSSFSYYILEECKHKSAQERLYHWVGELSPSYGSM